MKRKLKLLIFLSLIFLCLFMLRVISRLGNGYMAGDPDAGAGNLTDVNEVTGNSESNTVSSDSTAEIKNIENTRDNRLGESTAAGTEINSSAEDILSADSGESGTANSDTKKASDTGSGFRKETSTTPMTRETLRKLPAGTVIDIKEPGDIIMDNCFYYEEIKDDIKARIKGKSYKEDCTVPYEDLRYIRVLYYGFDDKSHIGELIVNKAIASDIMDIFTELYEKQYPIERMVLVDEYDADDNASMAADNTSSFNYRSVPGSTHLSKHALGLAIDINPLYNPYIQYSDKETTILPVEGTKYADRTLDCPYYIDENDLCYQAFTKRGFTWGGFWKTEPDYQHFQKTIE